MPSPTQCAGREIGSKLCSNQFKLDLGLAKMGSMDINECFIILIYVYINMYTFRIYKRIYYIYWEMIYDTSWYIRDDDIYWGYTIRYIQLRMCSSHWQIAFPYIYADSHSLAMAHNTLHQAYTFQCPLIKLRLINENLWKEDCTNTPGMLCHVSRSWKIQLFLWDLKLCCNIMCEG